MNRRRKQSTKRSGHTRYHGADTKPVEPMLRRTTLAFCLLMFWPCVTWSSEYAIVTTSEIRGLSQELPAFVAFKTDRGFNVSLFDEMDWGGSGLVGDAAAEALRGFLQGSLDAAALSAAGSTTIITLCSCRIIPTSRASCWR